MGSDRSGATQGRPRSHADGPRRGPQRLKTTPRGLQRRPEAPRRAWKRFRGDFRAILGPPGPRKTSKSAVLSANSVVLAISLGSVQQRPKRLQKEPPWEARPGRPQERPKSRQHGSKNRPERAKRRPRPPRTAPGEPPRRLQGGLREHILASSWGPRGLIFEPSRRPFRASRAVR